MEEKNTRELILQKALLLFATKGYAALSMRDLASEVGIRVSSIYHHFSSKQEIFDALIQRATDIKDNLQAVFINAFSKTQEVERDAFVQTGVFFLTGYLQNPQIALLLKVLESERLHHEEAQRAWSDLVIEAPLAHETAIFSALKERGEIGEEPEALAAEYQSAIMLAYFSGDVERLKEQLDRFYVRVFVKNRNEEEESKK